MSMEDVVVKFQGGQCTATSCGSKNPVAGVIAMAMLQEMNGLNVERAQSHDTLQSQLAGLKLSGGIQLG